MPSIYPSLIMSIRTLHVSQCRSMCVSEEPTTDAEAAAAAREGCPGYLPAMTTHPPRHSLCLTLHKNNFMYLTVFTDHDSEKFSDFNTFISDDLLSSSPLLDSLQQRAGARRGCPPYLGANPRQQPL